MMLDLSLSALRALGFLFYIIALLLLVCIVRAFGCSGTKKFILWSAPVFAFCAFASSVLHIYTKIDNITATADLKAFVIRALSLPVWAAAVAAALCLASAVVTLVRVEKTGGRELTAQSVCEGLDQLPDGICVSLPDGFPRLVNDQMQHISNAAFGEGVLDTVLLDKRVQQRAFQSDCRLDERNGNAFLCLPDGSVWQMIRRPLVAENRELTETIAYDVTKRYHDLLELQQRNERLAAVNRQLRDSLNHMDRIVREKEILSAKIKLHSNLGQGLLAVETYLTGGETSRKTVIRQLTQTVALLHGDSTSAEEQTNGRLDALFEAAKAVGVEIKIDGDIPELHRQLIEVAIHECLTNTVKHAAGHRLDVAIRRDGETTTVVLTNDGAPPAGPIRETGGLANLRKLTEKQGGVLEIERAPVFCATLRLKEEDI